MFLTDLFNFKKTCRHEQITPDMEFGYCPDCGKLIRNDWYITRCGCCGVKIKAMVHNGEVIPQNHYFLKSIKDLDSQVKVAFMTL